LASSDFGALLSRTQAELAEVDSQRRDATTRLVDADEHRRRHAEVLSALRTLVAVEVPVENAASIAVDALRRYRDQVALTGRLPELGQALDEARSLAARQTRVRTEADRLSVTLSAEPAAATIRLLLEQVEGERTECEERGRNWCAIWRTEVCGSSKSHWSSTAESPLRWRQCYDGRHGMA
jgi:chromosome partition protein MukB